MKILAIGNSFSQDATRYLKQIAECDGEKIKVVNLFIGGCPLRRHFANIMADSKSYSMEYGGEKTGFFVSIKEALLSEEWDVVTMQQASPDSFKYETYQPYLTSLADYVRTYAPKAKLYMHQTWSYEEGHGALARWGFKNQAEMFAAIEDAYEKAAKSINADGILKSGKLLQLLLQNGIEKVHRDGAHISLGAGRYATALLWYATLCKKDVKDNSFCNFDELLPESDVKIIKDCVMMLSNFA